MLKVNQTMHDNPTKLLIHPARTQINLDIRTV